MQSPTALRHSNVFPNFANYYMIFFQSLILIKTSVGRGYSFAKSRQGLLIIVKYFSKAGRL